MTFSLKHMFHDLWHDVPTRALWFSALVCNLGLWAIFFAVVPRGDQFVPLHYTIYFGIDLTTHWIRSFTLPSLGTAVLLIHILTVGVVDDQTWRRTWLIVATVINGLLLIAGLAVARVMQSSI